VVGGAVVGGAVVGGAVVAGGVVAGGVVVGDGVPPQATNKLAITATINRQETSLSADLILASF